MYTHSIKYIFLPSRQLMCYLPPITRTRVPEIIVFSAPRQGSDSLPSKSARTVSSVEGSWVTACSHCPCLSAYHVVWKLEKKHLGSSMKCIEDFCAMWWCVLFPALPPTSILRSGLSLGSQKSIFKDKRKKEWPFHSTHQPFTAPKQRSHLQSFKKNCRKLTTQKGKMTIFSF